MLPVNSGAISIDRFRSTTWTAGGRNAHRTDASVDGRAAVARATNEPAERRSVDWPPRARPHAESGMESSADLRAGAESESSRAE